MKAFDKTVSMLCEQIDMLEHDVTYWKDKYENEVRERDKENNERCIQAKKDLGNVLSFAFAVQHDKDGNLIIPAEDAKIISKNWEK